MCRRPDPDSSVAPVGCGWWAARLCEGVRVGFGWHSVNNRVKASVSRGQSIGLTSPSPSPRPHLHTYAPQEAAAPLERRQSALSGRRPARGKQAQHRIYPRLPPSLLDRDASIPRAHYHSKRLAAPLLALACLDPQQSRPYATRRRLCWVSEEREEVGFGLYVCIYVHVVLC